jgi:hypothetical protein
MNNDQAKAYLDQCADVLAVMLGGTPTWERMPIQYCKPENIGGYIEAGLKNPSFLTQNTIRNGANIAHGLIENLAREMEEWAKANGREDLLIPMSQKIDNAIAAGPDA